MHEEFLPKDSESTSAEVSPQAFSVPSSGKEYVKVMVVGSRKGIDIMRKMEYIKYPFSPPFILQ